MLQPNTLELTPFNLIIGLAVISIIYNTTKQILRNHRIRKLGAHAPVRHTLLPYGIDMVYDTVQHAVKDQTRQMWDEMFRKYGKGGFTVEAQLVNRLILTADPENIKAILATQFKDFGKGEEFRRDWYPFLGNGIFTTDGNMWHNSRQLIRPQFIKDRLSDLDIFEEHFQAFTAKIGNQGKEVDALDIFMRYTLDAATHFLLGRSVDSINNPAVDFANAFANAQRVQSYVARVGPLNWLVPRKRMGFFDSMKIINDFINPYIDEALRLPPEELEKKTNHDEGYTFLHAISGYTKDRTVLRDQIISILLAGRDTTACTLTWTIYELSLQPHITAKLRQEIINTVGLERAPAYDDLKDMKYLQHVINETLRLYPVVPFNVRFALKDTTLPVGGGPDGTQPIGILKDTPIGYSTLMMQRRGDLYPSEASGFPHVDQFVPERWDGWTPRSWTYIPFNGGPRICIGQQFALTEMAYTLVRLFQRYETVENRMNGQEAGMHSDIVLQPSNVVKVAFLPSRGKQ
ncbi:cytochrome P450 52A11 [Delitschia confertaspora ATCC 74209]|uniref:Cytochrome P450 52A11 n=1 Tax=Delitschia confertaspora ATCC 74209 TaxID=1513339 RepID=A0A9P4JTM9_9PLEO|nr:cytochrome P450 52A11 [Delitschia confertaspora ATCC 74209]